MKAAPAFGEVRSLLNQKPSELIFEKLADLAGERTLDYQTYKYADDCLSRWPTSIPRWNRWQWLVNEEQHHYLSWANSLLRPNETCTVEIFSKVAELPYMYNIQKLNLHIPYLEMLLPVLETVCSTRAFSNLRALSLSEVELGSRLHDLFSAPICSRVESLSINDNTACGKSLVSSLITSGLFARLLELELMITDITAKDLIQLFRSTEPHILKRLQILWTCFRPDSLINVIQDGKMKSLEQLEISAGLLNESVLENIAKAELLPSLQKLVIYDMHAYDGPFEVPDDVREFLLPRRYLKVEEGFT